MKLENKTINYKLGLLKLAMELDNVSLACNCSRPTYYRYKKLYLEGGKDALRNSGILVSISEWCSWHLVAK